MATAQRTPLRTAVGAPRHAAGQLKSVLHNSVRAAPRTIFFTFVYSYQVGKLDFCAPDFRAI